MKKINSAILKARMDDKQLLIQQACFLESLETKGKSTTELLTDAKVFLDIPTDDSVIANHQNVVKEYNKISGAVVNLNRTLVSLGELNLLNGDKLTQLNDLHNEMVDKLCDLYKISKDELFLEE